MNQSTSINTKLIESLAQIILSLTDEERQLLVQKVQYLSLSADEVQQERAVLQREIALGAEQLKNGDYTEYDDFSLPKIFENIKIRGTQGL